jgi:hypothetical protein
MEVLPLSCPCPALLLDDGTAPKADSSAIMVDVLDDDKVKVLEDRTETRNEETG